MTKCGRYQTFPALVLCSSGGMRLNLVDDLLDDLSVMSCLSVFLRSFFSMPSSLFIHCSRLLGNVKSSVLKVAASPNFLFHSSACW